MWCHQSRSRRFLLVLSILNFNPATGAPDPLPDPLVSNSIGKGHPYYALLSHQDDPKLFVPDQVKLLSKFSQKPVVPKHWKQDNARIGGIISQSKGNFSVEDPEAKLPEVVRDDRSILTPSGTVFESNSKTHHSRDRSVEKHESRFDDKKRRRHHENRIGKHGRKLSLTSNEPDIWNDPDHPDFEPDLEIIDSNKYEGDGALEAFGVKGDTEGFLGGHGYVEGSGTLEISKAGGGNSAERDSEVVVNEKLDISHKMAQELCRTINEEIGSELEERRSYLWAPINQFVPDLGRGFPLVPPIFTPECLKWRLKPCEGAVRNPILSPCTYWAPMPIRSKECFQLPSNSVDYVRGPPPPEYGFSHCPCLWPCTRHFDSIQQCRIGKQTHHDSLIDNIDVFGDTNESLQIPHYKAMQLCHGMKSFIGQTTPVQIKSLPIRIQSLSGAPLNGRNKCTAWRYLSCNDIAKDDDDTVGRYIEDADQEDEMDEDEYDEEDTFQGRPSYDRPEEDHDTAANTVKNSSDDSGDEDDVLQGKSLNSRPDKDEDDNSGDKEYDEEDTFNGRPHVRHAREVNTDGIGTHASFTLGSSSKTASPTTLDNSTGQIEATTKLRTQKQSKNCLRKRSAQKPEESIEKATTNEEIEPPTKKAIEETEEAFEGPTTTEAIQESTEVETQEPSVTEATEEASVAEATEETTQDASDTEATEETTQDASVTESTEEATEEASVTEATEETTQDASDTEATEETTQHASVTESTEEATQDASDTEATEETTQHASVTESTEEATQDATDTESTEETTQDASVTESTEEATQEPSTKRATKEPEESGSAETIDEPPTTSKLLEVATTTEPIENSASEELTEHPVTVLESLEETTAANINDDHIITVAPLLDLEDGFMFNPMTSVMTYSDGRTVQYVRKGDRYSIERESESDEKRESKEKSESSSEEMTGRSDIKTTEPSTSRKRRMVLPSRLVSTFKGKNLPKNRRKRSVDESSTIKPVDEFISTQDGVTKSGSKESDENYFIPVGYQTVSEPTSCGIWVKVEDDQCNPEIPADTGNAGSSQDAAFTSGNFVQSTLPCPGGWPCFLDQSQPNRIKRGVEFQVRNSKRRRNPRSVSEIEEGMMSISQMSKIEKSPNCRCDWPCLPFFDPINKCYNENGDLLVDPNGKPAMLPREMKRKQRELVQCLSYLDNDEIDCKIKD